MTHQRAPASIIITLAQVRKGMCALQEACAGHVQFNGTRASMQEYHTQGKPQLRWPTWVHASSAGQTDMRWDLISI